MLFGSPRDVVASPRSSTTLDGAAARRRGSRMVEAELHGLQSSRVDLPVRNIGSLGPVVIIAASHLTIHTHTHHTHPPYQPYIHIIHTHTPKTRDNIIIASTSHSPYPRGPVRQLAESTLSPRLSNRACETASRADGVERASLNNGEETCRLLAP